MIRPIALGLVAALALSAAPQAFADPAPAAAAAPAYSTASTIGDLLANPATKAVLVKYIPDVVASPQIDQAAGYPLDGIAQMVPALTPDVMAKINADLAKIPKS